ncbi:TPM domain-containing protein [Flavobacterium sp.]|uniref:TPM domain-containing protein n=1 Tax=Flavobacterium sp. TaxID=239 RepID=UPI00260F4607|nr:TPM domain-containing protein [Flavobacterium sp.]MDD3005293.1 TPM domain-containing protein [Flavobacterium sp.]
MNPNVEAFLNPNDEIAIVEAIHLAEQNTSGEIRIHIENHSEKPPLERAKEVFFELKMNETKARNGVLFYIGVADHSFAILGDEGIDQVVEADFWDCTKDVVIANFKEGKFKEGLVEGIKNAGEKLKTHFPFNSNDENELSNEISRS